MGLDMYAFTTRTRFEKPVDFDASEMDCERLHYWRKHPNLHGWMAALYFEKGGANPDFNCAPVQLLTKDLDRLEADIRNRRLPATSGFFFGVSDGFEQEDDLQFVAKAREALAAGLTVFYDSWW